MQWQLKAFLSRGEAPYVTYHHPPPCLCATACVDSSGHPAAATREYPYSRNPCPLLVRHPIARSPTNLKSIKSTNCMGERFTHPSLAQERKINEKAKNGGGRTVPEVFSTEKPRTFHFGSIWGVDVWRFCAFEKGLPSCGLNVC